MPNLGLCILLGFQNQKSSAQVVTIINVISANSGGGGAATRCGNSAVYLSSRGLS